MFKVFHALIAPLRSIKAVHASIVAQRRERDALIRIVDQLKAEDAASRKVFVDLAALAHEIPSDKEVK
jgi:hypothetical protein